MGRAEMRKKAKEFNTPHKLEMLERQIRAMCRQEYEERLEYETARQAKVFITTVTYVLWYKFGIGAKRMKKFTDELHRHLDILHQDKKFGLSIDDMLTMLKEEGKIDLRF